MFHFALFGLSVVVGVVVVVVVVVKLFFVCFDFHSFAVFLLWEDFYFKRKREGEREAGEDLGEI